ncbi:acyl carrier protein [Anaerovorax odorimutans]|uniref:Acyl carrier protein n=1 Tax=Anaerovorax odorimutans TaxID=109327 RepID=A0ABT1RTJ3_9FIRM|nr:acyl carrier protein [Anaerovorax odorimutans]MCQ4638485.1 acyl carrier protein [Anaerovorax odorimutans]
MQIEKIEDEIIKILIKNKFIKKNEIVNKNADLFETYGINSILAVNLLVELEEVFKITLNDDDLLPDNYKSLNKLVSTINKYIG